MYSVLGGILELFGGRLTALDEDVSETAQWSRMGELTSDARGTCMLAQDFVAGLQLIGHRSLVMNN